MSYYYVEIDTDENELYADQCVNMACGRCEDCLQKCEECGFENTCTRCLAHELWLQKNMEEERKKRSNKTSANVKPILLLLKRNR